MLVLPLHRRVNAIAVRKPTISYVPVMPLTVEMKVDFAFTLTDANGNGHIERECDNVVVDVGCG